MSLSCLSVHHGGVRVLVVEDQRVLADRIAEGLRDQGMAVDVAYDGATAMEVTAGPRVGGVGPRRGPPPGDRRAGCGGARPRAGAPGGPLAPAAPAGGEPGDGARARGDGR